jgi:hypothetical protein
MNDGCLLVTLGLQVVQPGQEAWYSAAKAISAAGAPGLYSNRRIVRSDHSNSRGPKRWSQVIFLLPFSEPAWSSNMSCQFDA